MAHKRESPDHNHRVSFSRSFFLRCLSFLGFFFALTGVLLRNPTSTTSYYTLFYCTLLTPIFFYDFFLRFFVSSAEKKRGGGVGWRRIYGGAFSFSTKLSSATKKLDGDKTTHSQKKSHSKLQGRKTRPNIFLGCLIFISPFIFQRECSSCNVLLFEMNSYSF